LAPKKLVVAFRDEDVRDHHLDSIVSLLHPGAVSIGVQGKTEGAACTALLAIGLINNDDELLIVSANEFLEVNFSEVLTDFRSRKLDAGVVVFRSIHPRYSYVRINNDGFVVEASEKKPISTNATAGFYWFSRGHSFVEAAKSMIRKDARVNRMFYICPTFNELILNDRRVGVYKVENKYYHPLKDSRQVDQFEAVLDREKSL